MMLRDESVYCTCYSDAELVVVGLADVCDEVNGVDEAWVGGCPLFLASGRIYRILINGSVCEAERRHTSS